MSPNRSTQRRRPARGAPQVRYVTHNARDVFDPEQLTQMHAMCRSLERPVDPLEAEQLASRQHGRMWELRHQATTRRQPNWSFGLGAPFARQVARFGGAGAKALLITYGYLAPPRLGRLCLDLARDLDVPAPDWTAEIGSAELTRAAVDRRPGDGEIVLLEFRRGRRQPFTLAVFVSATKGGIAKRYALMMPFEGIAEHGDPDGPFTANEMCFSPLDAGEACDRIRLAIERADEVDASRLDIPSAKALRALTLARIRPYLAGHGRS